MKDLTQKKQLSVDECKKLDYEFIQVIREAAEKNDMKLIIEGNALKGSQVKLVIYLSKAGTLEESIKIPEEK